MKRLLFVSAAIALTGCAWDYSKAAPQIPAAPSLSAKPAAQVVNPPAPAFVAAPAPAPTPQPIAATEPSSRTDYGVAANWLCKPGMANNPCEVNIDATIVKADGSTSIEKFTPNPAASIDCFYVYPTVSLDPFTQSDLIPGPEEFNVVKAQLARFGSQCRIYAPMYRQFSLGALRARMSGGAAVPTRGTPADAAADVDDAWAYYLKNENKGRGVVLIGHSQGSGQLIRLITSKIDGKADQAKIVSAIIMGGTVQVPKGADVGGTFKNIPACRTAGQTGCVITFSSFRDNVPPSDNASFGINRGETEALVHQPGRACRRQGVQPENLLVDRRQGMGEGQEDHHAIRHDAGPHDDRVREERQSHLPAGPLQRRHGRCAHRRSWFRRDGAGQAGPELGPAPQRRQYRHGRSGRRCR